MEGKAVSAVELVAVSGQEGFLQIGPGAPDSKVQAGKVGMPDVQAGKLEVEDVGGAAADDPVAGRVVAVTGDPARAGEAGQSFDLGARKRQFAFAQLR